MVDLDVSGRRVVDIDVLGFQGFLSGQFRCFLVLQGLCDQYRFFTVCFIK